METTNFNTMKKDDLIKALQNRESELSELKVNLESKDKELNNVKSDIESLKEMFAQMKAMQSQPKVENVYAKTPDEDIVKVGSCLVGRHILCDNHGNEIIDLADFGDIASISVRILDTVMTPMNKDLFRKGLIYFLDNRLYDRYSIKKPEILDDEMVDEIYSLPSQEMFKKINSLTEDKSNKRTEYMLYWKLVHNIADGRKGYQDRNREYELTSYFGTEISNSINLLRCAKEQDFK